MNGHPALFLSVRNDRYPRLFARTEVYGKANTMSVMTITRSSPSLASILRWSAIGVVTTLGVTITLVLAVCLILVAQVNAVVSV